MKYDTLKDPRIEKILHLIMEYAGGNLEAKVDAADQFDEIDGIIGGLNMLGEELKASMVSREFLENIIQSMFDGILVLGTDMMIQEMNPSMESLPGISKKDLVNSSVDLIFGEDQDFKNHLIHELSVTGAFRGKEYRYIYKNTEKYMFVSGFGIRNNYGKIKGYILSFHDITLQKQKEEELRISAVAFESNEGIIITDPETKIIRVNRTFQKITGYSSKDVVGKKPSFLSAGHHNADFYKVMWAEINRTRKWEGEVWNRRKNGDVYIELLSITAIKDDDGNVTQYVGIFNDITKRKEAEEEIRNLAFYDPLTGLPNRRLLMENFHHALSRSERTKYFGAVIFIDLDNFKKLNDTKGHEYGDMLLFEVAGRLSSCLREVDTVARLGGDEFVILIEELSKDENQSSEIISKLAEKIQMKLNQPYNLEGYSYFSSSSIGISLYRGHDKSVSELLKFADLAMYSAKESGRNAVRFFNPVMQNKAEKFSSLEVKLRNAVLLDQFILNYQVQVNGWGLPVGTEALIRWNSPELGMMMPDQFIPVAEKINLIIDLGQWVIDTACMQLERWSHDERMKDLTLSVNVSVKQFEASDFVSKLKSAVALNGINPSLLILEITEHCLVNNVSDVISKMDELRNFGIQLSIDDFGTGYSSLSYLKQLPINQIKIDKSFLNNIPSDLNNSMMIKAIVNLAKNLNLDVLAEGVETVDQQNFLRDIGCESYQGYLFSKPIPLSEYEQYIKMNLHSR
ncbi:MAG: EAL domain-containing protein [Spirochaetia bacterium]|nr:EAL domain-containing protein [Spirochaetia bacterium]